MYSPSTPSTPTGMTAYCWLDSPRVVQDPVSKNLKFCSHYDFCCLDEITFDPLCSHHWHLVLPFFRERWDSCLNTRTEKEIVMWELKSWIARAREMLEIIILCGDLISDRQGQEPWVTLQKLTVSWPEDWPNGQSPQYAPMLAMRVSAGFTRPIAYIMDVPG